jgi:dolichol-phosphate mannosyltransferase
MNALVIIPTYNERENIPPLVEQLLRHDGVRVLVVDDQSPDGTGAVADTLARQHPGRVEVLHRTANRGFGRSYIDGIKHAIAQGADLICQMDADFSHDPARLPALLAAHAKAAES